ncbi:LysR family transcriptional regulator [Salipiger pacificus]|nr:LysR family transcriptional regulator [Alloyangia pacifica]
MLHSRMLTYLDEVARAGSVRKAAERLNVSPTAVNRQVLLLEEAMGEPLFQRLPRGMKLTTAGEVVIEHVRRTMRDYRRISERLETMRGLGGNEVRIATMNGLVSGAVPRVLQEFAADHPHVRVSCRTAFIRDIVQQVLDGESDIGLGYNLPQDPQLTVHRSYEAPLGVVVSPDHPLARRGQLRPSDCLPYPLILPDETLRMHRVIRDCFLAAGAEIRPSYQTNSIDMMRQMALTSDGLCFLPAFDVAPELAERRLVHIPLADRAMAANRLMLMTRRGQVLGPVTLTFMDRLMEYLDACD